MDKIKGKWVITGEEAKKGRKRTIGRGENG